MKIVTKTLFGCFKSVFLLLVLSCVTASASAKNNPIAATTSIGTYTIKGAVKDAETKAPIVGASVLLEGTSKGALTDENGNFTLVLDDKDKKGTLVISFVGYETQKVVLNGQETLSIALEEGKNLEEVVVTGVLDARTRLEASTAISVLKTKDIERLAPQSAVDLLKNIPGVFVTSARGEIANTVYVRGLSDFPNFYGFYYVSMQEDGLPISAINNGVDFYLRADATVSKIEAVRGGSASILGPNAPGGIFNYISKTGGETFGGEVRTRLGLEGDGRNPYYRADVTFGGPLSKDKSWRYNIGGFYRASYGARNIGYLYNNGGQVKANITKTYSKGSFKIFTKYLKDHNAFTQLLPTTGWDTQDLIPGAKLTDAYDLPKLKVTLPQNGGSEEYDSERKLENHNYYAGFNWLHNLGNGLTIKNDFRYASYGYFQNSTQLVSPVDVTSAAFHNPAALYTMPGSNGLYTFTDRVTGKVLGTVTKAGATITPGANNAFPGGGNNVLWLPIFYGYRPTTEVTEQLMLSKKFKNMSFTLGGFYSKTDQKIKGVNNSLGTMYGTLQHQPHPIDVTLLGTDGKTYKITSPEGIAAKGVAGLNITNAKQDLTALFLGHDWKISEKFNLDWGVRYEDVKNYGWNALARFNPSKGGADGDSLTLYDNFGGISGEGDAARTFNYTKKLNYVSYSAGLNFKIDNNQALYVRYSQGNKSPDISYFWAIRSAFQASDAYPVIAQKLTQIELAYKLSTQKLKLFVTPFYSFKDNVPTVQLATNADQTSYTPDVQLGRYRTIGVELEANANITDNFNVRASATLQQGKTLYYTFWNLLAPGKADDVLIKYADEKDSNFGTKDIPNLPKVVFSITPSYTKDRFYAGLNYSYFGKRAANVQSSFYMKGYGTADLTLQYAVSKALSVQFNVNNLTNNAGVLSWLAPGPFPANNNLEAVTPAYIKANPTAVFSALRNQPRSYFFTASYKF